MCEMKRKKCRQIEEKRGEKADTHRRYTSKGIESFNSLTRCDQP